jgi:hypothetical protein
MIKPFKQTKSIGLIVIILLVGTFQVQGQVKDTLLNVPNIFYSGKPLGDITFLDDDYKIRSYGDKIILLDEHNLAQDTLIVESKFGHNIVHAIVRLDSETFSISTNQLAYLIGVKSGKLVLLKQYSGRQIRKIVGKSHYAILTKNGMITFYSKKRRDIYEYECYIVNAEDEVVKKLKYSVNKEGYPKALFNFPYQFQYMDGKLAFTNQDNNSYFVIDLQRLKINKIPILDRKSDVRYQVITYDFHEDKHYLIRVSNKNLIEILYWDIMKNEYHKLNATQYPLSSIRCSIYNKHVFFIGKFIGERAWYLVPINEIHQFNN